MRELTKYEIIQTEAKDDIIDKIREFVRDIIREKNTIRPIVNFNTTLDSPYTTLESICSDQDDLFYAANIFRNSCRNNETPYRIDIKTIYPYGDMLCMACDAYGKNSDSLPVGLENVRFELRIRARHPYVSKKKYNIFTDSIYDGTNSISDFLTKFSRHTINSENASLFSKLFFNEANSPFIHTPVPYKLIRSLEILGATTVADLGYVLSDEVRYLFQTYTDPTSPIKPRPSSPYLFAIAIIDPDFDYQTHLFPEHRGMPSLMSCDFAAGLINKMGEINFEKFRFRNNFQVIRQN